MLSTPFRYSANAYICDRGILATAEGAVKQAPNGVKRSMCRGWKTANDEVLATLASRTTVISVLPGDVVHRASPASQHGSSLRPGSVPRLLVSDETDFLEH